MLLIYVNIKSFKSHQKLDMKTCTQCGVEKPFNEYSLHRNQCKERIKQIKTACIAIIIKKISAYIT